MDANDLVVSELRGAQSGPDTYGTWIELYNASDATLDLTGLAVDLVKLDGSAEARVLVRARDLTLAAGAYVVLGRAVAGDEPAHVDYGYVVDFDADLYDNAAIELWGCQELVDRIVYRSLPEQGTLALDGSVAPNAAANDEADADDPDSAWCVDAAVGPSTELGAPGTPGEANPPCA
jgi:hypothetical protein